MNRAWDYVVAGTVIVFFCYVLGQHIIDYTWKVGIIFAILGQLSLWGALQAFVVARVVLGNRRRERLRQRILGTGK